MTPKEQLALRITTALIQADPTILKGVDPQMLDRRIRSVLEIYDRVNETLAHRATANS